MNRFAWVLIGILASAGMAKAALYEIPLPELKGVYSTGDLAPRGKDVAFTLAAFDRIDGVYVSIKGTIAPALLGRLHAGEIIDVPVGGEHVISPSDTTFTSVYFPFWVSIADPNSVREFGSAEFEETSSFGLTAPLRYFGNGTTDWKDWNFLLQQELAVRLALPVLGSVYPNFSYEVIPGLVGITEVKLLVDGVKVPEPTAALLILPASLILTRRTRRQVH